MRKAAIFLGALLVGVLRLWLPAEPRGETFPLPVLSTAHREDPGAVALLGRLRTRLLGGPFFAVAVLSIHRPNMERELVLRFYCRDAARFLVRVDGPPREAGTTLLRRNGRVYLFFPIPDLLLSLPSSMGSDRLFGSDFSMDDVLAPGGSLSKFTATFAGEETLSGVPCRRLKLLPRTPAASLYGEVRLWVSLDGSIPVRQELLSDRGQLLRVVTTGGGGKFPLPARWKAQTFGLHAGESRLEVRFFERNPSVPEELFTVERLRQWR